MEHAASVQGVALQVTKLDESGAPLVGEETSFITDAFMSFGFTPEYTTGDEIEEKSANGAVCVYFQGPDVLKRVTVSLAICNPAPELHEALIGGSLLVPAAPPTAPAIGYAAPEQGVDSVPNGVGIEVWSRAIVGGRPASTLPYWRFVFPYLKLRLSGDRVMENGAMGNEFEGWGVGNALYATGPRGDWDYTTERAFQYARVASAPTGLNEYFEVTSP